MTWNNVFYSFASTVIRSVSRNVARYTALALVGLTLTGVTLTAQAVPIIVPVALNPGDTYRLAFVASTSVAATNGNISCYNDFVNSLGLAATGIDGWTALASTSSVSASVNTSTELSDVGHPEFVLDGVSMIASSNADLWDGTLDVALNIDEQGNNNSAHVYAWTGTTTGGNTRGTHGFGTFYAGTHTASVGRVGSRYQWNFGPILDNSRTYGIYAISGVLTVAHAPSSGTIPLLGITLVALVLVRRKEDRSAAS
jgi:hypothetical protein